MVTSLRSLSSKQWDRIKIAMIKDRVIRIPITNIKIPYKWTNLAGHGSFVFLALSYLETDFFNLRAFALSGISLSIMFQYYRPIPLWIPIRWNALFFIINATMIAYILQEENTDGLTQEEVELYQEVFATRGMKLVDFRQLLSIADRYELEKGDNLIVRATANTHLHLIASGEFYASRGMNVVGRLHRNQFAGEMAFVRKYEQNIRQEVMLSVKDRPQSFSERLAAIPSRVAHYGYSFSTNTSKLFSSIHYRFGIMHNSSDSSRERRQRATEGGAREGAKVSDVARDMGKFNHSKAIGRHLSPAVAAGTADIITSGSSDISDIPLATADVTCSKKAVVFSWSFDELYELLHARPRLESMLESIISADLVNKLAAKEPGEPVLYHPHARYREALTRVLADGQVHKHQREYLEDVLREYEISEAEHEALLSELGWTLDEYLEGVNHNKKQQQR